MLNATKIAGKCMISLLGLVGIVAQRPLLNSCACMPQAMNSVCGTSALAEFRSIDAAADRSYDEALWRRVVPAQGGRLTGPGNLPEATRKSSLGAEHWDGFFGADGLEVVQLCHQRRDELTFFVVA
eukprot:CAMPEP_0115584908 /NCGR_PEP_ID=MMETSP0272-20121206/6926_1 /TAXON_ID=71861 /ORGANISM="Scrippsiella trochoidea, Strain CCMP3099" /LENGTH=125 /DNA_ID=CAMNT_0003019957 /DNA_START=61 /DNA_END=436 /DNA_ORIENTATION=+